MRRFEGHLALLFSLALLTLLTLLALTLTKGAKEDERCVLKKCVVFSAVGNKKYSSF
jgi:hypothetical protein